MSASHKAELYRRNIESLAIVQKSAAERLIQTAAALPEDDPVKYQLFAAGKALEQHARDLWKIINTVENQ